MESIAFGIANGTAFFVGLGIFWVSVALTIFSKLGLVRSFGNIGCLLSLGIVVLSGTPLPLWEYVAWGIITVGFLSSVNRFRNKPFTLQVGTLALAGTVALSMLMAVQELPYRPTPIFRVTPSAQVYVIGDSISAGMGGDKVLWPTVLSQITGLRVTNLAQPGATVESAQKQIAKIPKVPSVVILEIGGNDLLGGVPAWQFRKGLEAILVQLHGGGDQLLMFELPLYPLKNAFGQAQRDLAQKYGVTLVPKRVFTSILETEGATLDGLHLSSSGHRVFASTTAGILKITK